jgi:hypothetical protein
MRNDFAIGLKYSPGLNLIPVHHPRGRFSWGAVEQPPSEPRGVVHDADLTIVVVDPVLALANSGTSESQVMVRCF